MEPSRREAPKPKGAGSLLKGQCRLRSRKRDNNSAMRSLPKELKVLLSRLNAPGEAFPALAGNQKRWATVQLWLRLSSILSGQQRTKVECGVVVQHPQAWLHNTYTPFQARSVARSLSSLLTFPFLLHRLAFLIEYSFKT